MAQLDFLAIGDIVTEPFIKLLDAKVHCKIDTEQCEICMRFGDKIPYESATLARAVGNASNAAVAAARLGLSSALRAYVGDDEHGKGCLEVLTAEKVDTRYMVTEKGKRSNYHFVLWYENDRTILVKHEAYTYTVPDLTESPKWVYLSSLAANTERYHDDILELLKKHPETKLAFQPGTFQMKLGVEKLRGLYERASLFVCNKDEAARILGEDTRDPVALLAGLRALGPDKVIVTDNTNGAYAYDGSSMMKVPMYPDTRGAFERTGAGDAFASTVTAALALNKPFAEALLWAPINSMAVVQEVGAQKGLLSREALLSYIQNAPPSYRIEPLS